MFKFFNSIELKQILRLFFKQILIGTVARHVTLVHNIMTFFCLQYLNIPFFYCNDCKFKKDDSWFIILYLENQYFKTFM